MTAKKMKQRKTQTGAGATPTSWWGQFRAWRRARKARKNAKRFLKTGRKLLKKHRRTLTPENAEQVETALARLASALKEKDRDAIAAPFAELEDAIDRHLGFARKSAWRENLEALAIAVIIALILRAFVIEAFKIPSGSMIPTLEVGDHIFVNKFTYGLRVPFTSDPPRKFWASTPKRGDVVVFIYPSNPNQDFIKRVIAVEGDKVRVKNHTVFLTRPGGKEEEVTRKRLGTLKFCDYRGEDPGWPSGKWPWLEDTKLVYEETLDGTTFYSMNAELDDDVERLPPFEGTVPEGSVFVMGDHRDNSKDSREWHDKDGKPTPWVDIRYIKGKAMFVWFSSGGSTWNNCQDVTFWQNFSKWVRWGRFFQAVD